MTINDTVQLMTSDDYRKRFIAEYWQTKNRYDALHRMTIRYEAGTLDFKPSCSLELLKEQKMHRGQYLRVLEIRAEIEKINLHEATATLNAVPALVSEVKVNPIPSYCAETHAILDGSITAHS